MTQHHTTPPLPPTTPGPRRHRARVDAPTVAWPIGLVLLLVALGTWRASGDEPARADAPTDAPPVAPRTFEDARLEVPTGWRTLDRADGRITWGDADRSHTVTLASTESSAVALPTIAREVVVQSADALPESTTAGTPVVIDLQGRAPRGDSAVLVPLEVADGTDGPLQVVQVWRRDSRAGLDLVATWTSADGTWPASPRELLPSGSGGS